MIKVNLADISTEPGVYLFIGANQQIIYVGKAKSLRSRLASYFNAGVKTIKTERMLTSARSLRTVVTSNEVEAFLLESNLIKTEQPKYNILLKDSKGYPYVKLTNEEYPRLVYTRNVDDKDALYFGPFVNAGELRDMLEQLKDSFPLRTCTPQQMGKGKICLKYQIHKCDGPCEQLISKEEYDKIVKGVKRFFKGDTDEVKKELQAKMAKASEAMYFEDAAIYRDRINALSRLFIKQQAISTGEHHNLDLFYRYVAEHTVGVTQLFVRGGRIIGAKTHFFSPDEDDLLERFIMQFYANVRQFPDMIIAEGGELSDTLAVALTSMAGKKITIRKRGFGELVELAKKNAEHAAVEYTLKSAANKDLFPRLSSIAGRDVQRVECIDISHLGGDNTVGVSVVSENGSFDKKYYRKYKIKSAENNDVQSITELLERKMINVADGSEQPADLYLIDGGVSQLNAAAKVLARYSSDAACLSISKSRSQRPTQHESSISIEEIHEPGRKNPLKFKKNDTVLLFLQKMRDEAHRFAIAYSRKLSLKKSHISTLMNIDGVGESRAKSILISIPDLYSNKDLTAEEISKKGKVPLAVAEKVLGYIKLAK